MISPCSSEMACQLWLRKCHQTGLDFSPASALCRFNCFQSQNNWYCYHSWTNQFPPFHKKHHDNATVALPNGLQALSQLFQLAVQTDCDSAAEFCAASCSGSGKTCWSQQGLDVVAHLLSEVMESAMGFGNGAHLLPIWRWELSLGLLHSRKRVNSC